MISVNECDPLHDEGVVMYRKLVRAGVQAQCRAVMGTAHAAELFSLLPEVSRTTAASIATFVRHVRAEKKEGKENRKSRL